MNVNLRLISYLIPYWKRLLVSMFCMIMYALLDGVSLVMLIPFLQVLFDKPVLEAGLDNKVMPPLSDGFSLEGMGSYLKQEVARFIVVDSSTGTLANICILILVIFFLKNLFGYLQAYLSVSVELSVVRKLRDELYGHLHNLSFRFFQRTQVGQLISRMTNDMNQIKNIMSNSFTKAARSGFLIIVYIVILLWISWKLTLVVLLVLPPIMYVVVSIGKKLRKRSRKILNLFGILTSIFQETISGIRVVKAFSMEKFELEKFKDSNRRHYKADMRARRMSRLSGPISEFLYAVGTVAVLWYGGRLILVQGELETETFILFLTTSLRLNSPVKFLGNFNDLLQPGLAACDRIFNILDTKPVIVDAPNPIEVTEFKSSIVFENVCFSYDTAFPVLENIDLEITKGSALAIVGPSGAGKTTLVDLIPRFYDITQGQILFDGIDIREISVKSLRRVLGIVTQDTILFNDTVKNNIAYGIQDTGIEKIKEAAEAANAHDFIMEMPEGYDTFIGERGMRLSGGQRQRLAIARAILKDPAILIFDEATSSLDTESELLVQQAIERLMENRTSIVIAHRLSTVQHCDVIIVMQDGKIIERGSHWELIERSGLYNRLYEMQFRNV